MISHPDEVVAARQRRPVPTRSVEPAPPAVDHAAATAAYLDAQRKADPLARAAIVRSRLLGDRVPLDVVSAEFGLSPTEAAELVDRLQRAQGRPTLAQLEAQARERAANLPAWLRGSGTTSKPQQRELALVPRRTA